MNIGFTQLMGNTGTVTMTSDGFTVSTNPAQYSLLAGGSENEFIELRLN